MSVYVDPLIDYGWRLGPSCHMFADTLEELHDMAKRIGMKRAWFQDKETLPHYDLVKSRRDKAVALGAVEVSIRVTAEAIRIRRTSMSAPDYGEPWTTAGAHFAVNCRKESVSKLFFESRDRDRIISCVNACAGIEDPEALIPLLVELAAAAEPYTGVSKAIDTVLHEIAALQPKREGET